MNPTAHDSLCWNHFWQSGRKGCCSDCDGSANAERIREQWVSLFKEVGTGTRVLDVCTGNGAVLEVALEQPLVNDGHVELYGVDSAIIAPEISAPGHAGTSIHFVRASVTRLPFPDALFDIVTSQFGIEYGPADAAIPEVMRVLKDGGTARFVMHAKDGVTAERAKTEIADIDRLLHEVEIFPVAVEALTQVVRVERDLPRATATQVEKARAAHRRFHERLEMMAEGLQRRPAFVVYRNVGSILQHTYLNRRYFDLERLLDKVREAELSVMLHRERLQALIDSALDDASCAHIVAGCRRHAAGDCAYRPIVAEKGDRQLGWVVTISK